MPASEHDVLHLGCGNDRMEGAWNVDRVDTDAVDEVFDLERLPWPFAKSSWESIEAHHVFEHLGDIEAALRESAHVLKPGGTLTVTVPVGVDAVADPDHTWGLSGTPWTWRTPVFYTGERHWDVDVGLEVVDRDVRLWSHHDGLLRLFHQFMIDTIERMHGQGVWMFDQPATSGEFTVVFHKNE